MLPVAENGYTDEEMDQYTRQLKENGIVNFLRSYLTLTEDGEMRSLRKLLLGFGLVPVGRRRFVISVKGQTHGRAAAFSSVSRNSRYSITPLCQSCPFQNFAQT